MLTKRIIPIIDTAELSSDETKKLTAFYNTSGADEVFVSFDILEQENFIKSLSDIAGQLFVPLTVSGNINNLESFQLALDYGADKINLKKVFGKNTELIQKAATKFGDQAVVTTVNVAKVKGKYNIVEGGKFYPDLDRKLKELDRLGIGEIIIHSLDAEQRNKGFDTELLKSVVDLVEVPIIASGGAATKEDFVNLYEQIPEISGCTAGELFISRKILIPDLKKYLKANSIPIRI